MSYLDRIQFANRRDLTGFIPWMVEGSTVGYLRPRLRDLLEDWSDVFCVTQEEVSLHPDLIDFETRSSAVARVLLPLFATRVSFAIPLASATASSRN